MNAFVFDNTYERAHRWTLLKNRLADWRLHWFLLLLPAAFLLPAMPIDETRYLAVAWEIYVRQDYLVLHLNGVPYADKGPLLFWLINLGWLFVKPSVWLVRVEMLLVSSACLWMLQRLARRLGGSVQLADHVGLIFCGMLYTVVFAEAIMFDVLLTACLLVALHGVVDLHMNFRRWGIAMIAIGLGLGVLAKGPVALLDGVFVLLLGPLWSQTARRDRSRWYRDSALGLLGAASIALCWAVPAALRGGSEYAHAIFLGQTVGRLANSFAHARPTWWYFAVLPLMFLPWTISVRASFNAGWRALVAEPLVRFALTWFVPTFAVFCAISGKQAHYLFPLLPGAALACARLLELKSVSINSRAFGWAVLVFALCFFACANLPFSEAANEWFGSNDAIDALRRASFGVRVGCPVLVGLIGGSLAMFPAWHRSIRCTAFASIAAGVVCLIATSQLIAARLDLEAAGRRIREAQDSAKPIASIGSGDGMLTFAGRVIYPVHQVEYADLRRWCSANPTGELFSIYEKYRVPAAPVFEQSLLSEHVRFWRASDVCETTRQQSEQR